MAWRLARDPELQDVVARGSATAAPERDWTVKVDPAGLEPGTRYWYAFSALGHDTTPGRTRTLPVGATPHLRIAFASCSNYNFGFFNAYGLIAERDDLDLVLHLGDYIYEYANGEYGDGTELGRVPEPLHEIVSLADYRLRYASYRNDPDLQEVHARHPFVTVWDDHELANNAWRDGAQNHGPDEGPWAARRRASVRAYFEWLPIRQSAVHADSRGRIHRSFRLGDLADLIMLDTRLVGRDRQAESPDHMSTIWSPERSMLGSAQESWLFEELLGAQRDGMRWKVLGQQVMFGQLRGSSGRIVNTDMWDGYARSRIRVLDHLESHDIDDVVILTGDLHSSWAQDITRDPWDPSQYDAASGRGSRAVEFVTPGITSPGFTKPDKAEERTRVTLANNPHLRWVDFTRRGYAVLDLTHQAARAEWYFVDSVRERRRSEELGAAWQTRSGRNSLREVHPVEGGAGF